MVGSDEVVKYLKNNGCLKSNPNILPWGKINHDEYEVSTIDWKRLFPSEKLENDNYEPWTFPSDIEDDLEEVLGLVILFS